MRLLLATISAALLVSQTAVSPAQDARVFVRFPEPMQEHMLGNMRDHLIMHHAASRLAIVLQDTSVSPSLDTMRDVSRAIHEVTATCIACHAGYRIR
jgi:hypothetical protein